VEARPNEEERPAAAHAEANLPAERDAALVAAALRGESGAWAVLAERLRCVPEAVARRIGAHPGRFQREAKELLGSSIEALRGYRGEQPLEAWLEARVERALGHEAHAPADDPVALADEIDVAPILAATVDRRARPRGETVWQRARRGVPLVAVMTLVGLFLISDPELDPNRPAEANQLLGGELRLLAPVGESPSFGRFTWSAVPDAEYRARVVVTGPSGEVISSPLLEDAQWLPTPEQHRALPDRIRWEVIEQTSVGERRGWANAWLAAR
jgi:hypothetical protein